MPWVFVKVLGKTVTLVLGWWWNSQNITEIILNLYKKHAFLDTLGFLPNLLGFLTLSLKSQSPHAAACQSCIWLPCQLKMHGFSPPSALPSLPPLHPPPVFLLWLTVEDYCLYDISFFLWTLIKAFLKLKIKHNIKIVEEFRDYYS